VTGSTVFRTAAELRAAFDDSFAQPAVARDRDVESILLIRVRGGRFALKAIQIAGLAATGRILPIPSRIPEMIGVAGVRGKAAPVFDLGALLGMPASDAHCRWLALARGETALAFAFDEAEGHAVVAREDLQVFQGAAAGDQLRQVARIGDGAYPVIDIAAVVANIQRRAGLAPGAGSGKERMA
jgi:chemotaxis signal transduction protein